MKNLIKLRMLVSLSFAIFLFPFLQTCSDNRLREFAVQRVEIVETSQIDSTKGLNPTFSQNEIIVDNKIHKKDISKNKKEYTVNFYQLINRTFGDIKLNEYDKSTFSDKTFYPFFGFLLIFINSVLILIFTFFRKYKITFKLSILNITFFILSTLGLIFLEIVEEISQLRIGYYLFALNTIFIILTSKKEMKNQKLSFRSLKEKKPFRFAGGK